MAFWGVEVKPGNPYTHRYDETRGRLHIGQATLGFGSPSEKKVLVQCNVGNKSPVLICALFPEKSEWCPLNLEFEEDDDVAFSVLGPRSVHLSGYFLRPQIGRGGDDSDSYGEDIAETESDRSTDYDSEDDDEYEADFIDDGDIEMFPPSPTPNSGVRIEEIIDDEKPPVENGSRKRLKKKYQMSESDENDSLQQQVVVKGSRTPVLESEDEDGFPISFMSKNINRAKNTEAVEKLNEKTAKEGKKSEEKEKDDTDQAASFKRKIDAVDGDSERKAEKGVDGSEPSTNFGAENGGKQKKKKKDKVKQGKILDETVNVANDNKAKSEEAKTDGMDQDVPDNKEEEKTEKKKKKKKAKDKIIEDDKSIDVNLEPSPAETPSAHKKKNKKKKNTSEIDATEEGKNEPAKEIVKQMIEVQPTKTRTYPNGLIVEELSMGKPDGKRATAGKKVSLHYIGKLKKNGSIFDSNVGQRPFAFRLGIGQIIKGWDVGVEGMRVGDKRRLTIPPSMGYGSKGVGKIPPSSTLVFDVELVDVN